MRIWSRRQHRGKPCIQARKNSPTHLSSISRKGTFSAKTFCGLPRNIEHMTHLVGTSQHATDPDRRVVEPELIREARSKGCRKNQKISKVLSRLDRVLPVLAGGVMNDGFFSEPIGQGMTLCFVAVNLLQKQLCSRHTNQPGSAGPIVPCFAPDAIRNPPHVHVLSHAASPASGVRWLSGGVCGGTNTPSHTPLLWTVRAPLHLPGAGHGHARSFGSSVEPALLAHRARQVKWPRRHRRPMPLHRPS